MKKETAAEQVPKRRRYDPVADETKLLGDLVRVHEQARQSYLPTPSELYRLGYENLCFAVKKLGYAEVAKKINILSQPDYYHRIKNLDDELDRLIVWPDDDTALGMKT